MKITLDLTDNQLAKFGITEETPKDMIQTILSNAIDEQIPYRFVVECTHNTYDYDGAEIAWSEGGKYNVEYYYDIILADSNISNYEGALLNEDDFLNNFKVVDATPEVAKAMVDEGYADMFVDFLDEKDKPEELEFFVALTDNNIQISENGLWHSHQNYQVLFNPYTEKFRIERDDGKYMEYPDTDFIDFIDFSHQFKITKITSETVKNFCERGYDTFKKFAVEKNVEKGE